MAVHAPPLDCANVLPSEDKLGYPNWADILIKINARIRAARCPLLAAPDVCDGTAQLAKADTAFQDASVGQPTELCFRSAPGARQPWSLLQIVEHDPEHDPEHDHRAGHDHHRADHLPVFEHSDNGRPPARISLPMRKTPARHTHSETPFGPQQRRFELYQREALAGYSQPGSRLRTASTGFRAPLRRFGRAKPRFEAGGPSREILGDKFEIRRSTAAIAKGSAALALLPNSGAGLGNAWVRRASRCARQRVALTVC